MMSEKLGFIHELQIVIHALDDPKRQEACIWLRKSPMRMPDFKAKCAEIGLDPEEAIKELTIGAILNSVMEFGGGIPFEIPPKDENCYVELTQYGRDFIEAIHSIWERPITVKHKELSK